MKLKTLFCFALASPVNAVASIEPDRSEALWLSSDCDIVVFERMLRKLRTLLRYCWMLVILSNVKYVRLGLYHSGTPGRTLPREHPDNLIYSAGHRFSESERGSEPRRTNDDHRRIVLSSVSTAGNGV